MGEIWKMAKTPAKKLKKIFLLLLCKKKKIDEIKGMIEIKKYIIKCTLFSKYTLQNIFYWKVYSIKKCTLLKSVFY